MSLFVPLWEFNRLKTQFFYARLTNFLRCIYWRRTWPKAFWMSQSEALMSCRDGDLDVRFWGGELNHPDGCTRGPVSLEVRRVDGVHSLQQAHVR
jgi:hypothetical protein